MRRDSYLTLAQIRRRRIMEKKGYLETLRTQRRIRLEQTKELNREIKILNKLINEVKEKTQLNKNGGKNV